VNGFPVAVRDVQNSQSLRGDRVDGDHRGLRIQEGVRIVVSHGVYIDRLARNGEARGYPFRSR
jgi:hypothetical protein